MWGAVIGAAAGLIGGAQARKDERKGIREQNEYNHPSAIRARAEEAGFNPLLFIGPNTGTQTTAFQGGQMGQAITDAGMAIGSAVDQRSKQAKAIEQLEAQNEALRQRVTESARPPIGGIYSQSMPALASLTAGSQAVQTEEALPQLVSDPLDPNFVGPLPAVRVRSILNGRYTNLDPRLAAQLGKRDGDWLLAEDIEAIAGELVGEAFTTASAADGMLSGSGFFGDAFVHSPTPALIPASPPDAPPLPFGYQQTELDRIRQSFTQPYGGRR